MARFFRSNARRRVLTGPFGSGKSAACCVEIHRRAREQRPNRDGVRKSRWAVVRNTYPDLKNTTVKTYGDWFGDEYGPFINVAPFEHRVSYDVVTDKGELDGTTVECEVIFLAMDTEADAKKFLSLELTGIYFNELRELPRSLIEAGDGRLGRYPAMRDGGPSWYGMIADTNLFDEDHWLYPIFDGGEEGWEFFNQPGAVIQSDGKWVLNPQAENLKNLDPGYYSGQLAGKSDAWIRIHLAAEVGRLSTEGSYFGEDLALIERQGRQCDVVASPDLPVHTFWDIGISDYMSIWFGQAVGDDWNWIDFYQNHGQSIDHYVQEMQKRAGINRWTWGDHVWPHDGAHRDVGILGAKTRAEVFASLGMKAPIIMPRRANPADWIDAARLLIRRSRFNKETCRQGLMHLRKYSKVKDEVRNVYRNEPRHDEHSHAADAFQVAAMGRGKVSNNSAKWTPEIMNFRFSYAG